MGFTTGALLTGAALLGTGLEAYGQYKSAQDAAAAMDYNAAIKRQEADIARQKGKLDADRQRKKAKRFLATQEVLIAKSGIAFEGSSLEVWKDTYEDLELDAMILEYNAQVDEKRAIDESRELEQQAKNTRFAGTVRAATTVLKQSASFLASQGLKSSGGTVGSTGKTQSQILGFDTRSFR